MNDGTYGHVMTEVALALAMAFFSIMLLGLVFMEVPQSSVDVSHYEQLHVTKPLDQTVQEGQGDLPPLVIFFQGQFYDADLHPLLPAEVVSPRVLLAVAPTLALQEVLQVKKKILSPEVSITLLDQRWLTHLETLK